MIVWKPSSEAPRPSVMAMWCSTLDFRGPAVMIMRISTSKVQRESFVVVMRGSIGKIEESSVVAMRCFDFGFQGWRGEDTYRLAGEPESKCSHHDDFESLLGLDIEACSMVLAERSWCRVMWCRVMWRRKKV